MKRLDRSARARPSGPRPGSAEAVTAELDLVIEEVGARGDALAQAPDGPIYVPYALPGEVVRAQVAGARGVVADVLTASADRVAAPCPQFGRCGGCQLQHWAEGPYLAWKVDQVARALARRGVEAEIAPIVPAFADGRRRAAFHAVRAGKGVRFGFVIRGGGGVVAAPTCPVLTPALEAALPALRRLAEAFAPARGELTMPTVSTETGVDVDIKGAGALASFERRRLEMAAELAEALDLARLSFDGEIAVRRRAPRIAMGPVGVEPPPGAFLQPTRSGEEALARAALAAIAGAQRVADLFSGLGTFALRLALGAETHAVEGEAGMLAALKAAADSAAGTLKGVSVERRDLLRAPLSALEMKRFDAVVFDPPRSGARLQAEQIAASRVSKVAAVSCDPATFARDAKVLIDGGFRLDRVTPVDQFRWTPHIEVVGAFSR